VSSGSQEAPPHLPVDPKQPERSLGELLGQLGSDLGTLVRQEVELAKVETRQEMRKITQVVSAFGAGAMAAYLALLFASFALAWLLDQAMNTALAFLIVGVLYGIVAAVLFMQGRRRMAEVNMVPEQTVETVKEDVEWIRAQKT
jgi:F0F1-type ATP synthase assembly protein I